MKKIYTKAIALSCCLLIVINVYNILAYNEMRRSEHYRKAMSDELAEGAEIEREVTVFDRDEWRDHIGYDGEPDNIFLLTKHSDADRVGAKKKFEVLDIEREKDSLQFFDKILLEQAVEVEAAPDAFNMLEGFDDMKTLINGLSNISNPEGGPVLGMLWTVAFLSLFPPIPKAKLLSACENASNAAGEYSFDSDYVHSVYNNKIDGYILYRDVWDWTKEPYKKYPDWKKHEVPLIKDPDDWYNTWELLMACKDEFLNQVQEIIDLIIVLNDTLTELKHNNPIGWISYMAELILVLLAFGRIQAGETPECGDWGHTLIDAALNPTGENQLQDGQQGLYYITDEVAHTFPGKFGFLWMLLSSQLPVLSPVDKYLKDVIKAFDIDGRTVETGIRGLDPKTEIIGDAWVDGNTIVLEFKYADPYEERKGWTVEFTYDDFGNQEKVTFIGSGVFYEFITYLPDKVQSIIPVAVGIIIVVALSAIALISFHIRHKLKNIKMNKIRKKYGQTIKKMEK